MQKIIGLVGILVFILIAYLFSSNRKLVNLKIIIVSLICEFLIAVPIFLIPQSRRVLLAFSDFFTKILEAAREGIVFVFGPLGAANSPNGFILIFQSLTFIIIFSALFGLLYYLKIIPFIIVNLAKFVRKIFGISAVEALCSACNLFVGIESYASIRPYLNKITRSQIFLIFTVFMATIASSVMALYVSFLTEYIPTIAGHLVSASLLSIPAAIMISKIMEPEENESEEEEIHMDMPDTLKTFTSSIVASAYDGGKMVWGIAVLLIAVVGLLGIANMFLGYFTDITFTKIFGYIFTPFAFLMGVDWNDVPLVSQLLGTRILMTEVPSYVTLSQAMKGGLISPHSAMIASYALCGFASIESLSIATGAFVSLVPQKTELISKLSARVLLAATLATIITGTVAGLFYIG